MIKIKTIKTKENYSKISLAHSSEIKVRSGSDVLKYCHKSVEVILEERIWKRTSFMTKF